MRALLSRLSTWSKFTGKCLATQHVRTTYMVRRAQRLPPPDPDCKTPFTPYAQEHFYYEMVQDTEDVKDPDISVVLLSFVEGIGQPGDIVSLDAHFARFNLLLQKKAVYASPENIEEYAVVKDVTSQQYSSHTAPLTIRMLAQQIVSVLMSSTEPWTIQPWHVQTGLRLSGIAVAEGGVELPEGDISGPDMEKQNKDFLAYVVINDKERAPVRCRLHHINQELTPEWRFIPSPPILEAQAEELNKLALPKPEVKEHKHVRTPRKKQKR